MLWRMSFPLAAAILVVLTLLAAMTTTRLAPKPPTTSTHTEVVVTSPTTSTVGTITDSTLSLPKRAKAWAETWGPHEWLAFVAFAVAAALFAHGNRALAVTAMCAGMVVAFMPPATSASNSWLSNITDVLSDIRNRLAGMDDTSKLVFDGLLALVAITVATTVAYKTKDYPVVSYPLVALGFVLPIAIGLWAFGIVPNILTNNSPQSAEISVPQDKARALATNQRTCNLPKTEYIFGTVEPPEPFNPAGACAPDIWADGHCINVRPAGKEPVKVCPGEALPKDVASVWSADTAFNGFVALSAPRYVANQ